MAAMSKKYENFVSEPMGNKPVTALPGVGDVLGVKLVQGGFDKAYKVLGKFLSLNKKRQEFIKWLKDDYGARTHQARQSAQCLWEWCNNNL